MSDLCDRQFEEERLEKIKQIIAAIEDALLAFSTDGLLQSYTLDTGQTRQTVTRAEISSLKNTLAFWYSQYDTWCQRLTGCASRYVRPFR